MLLRQGYTIPILFSSSTLAQILPVISSIHQEKISENRNPADTNKLLEVMIISFPLLRKLHMNTYQKWVLVGIF